MTSEWLWALCHGFPPTTATDITDLLPGSDTLAALTLIFYPLDDLAKRHFTVAREMFDELPSESVNVS